MKLTIAFITKDRCNELIKALHSCFAQNFGEVQYVVVDNGSLDGTRDYLRELDNKNLINLKTYYSKDNLGVAGGRNKAMELADGEYVFFLDDDAVIESENLFTIICKYMDENNQVGALALKTYEEITKRYLKGALVKYTAGSLVDTLQYIGCAHVLRKAIFENQKLYPSRLGYGSEELYASLRIWKRGYLIKYLNDVMIRHIPSPSNRLSEREREYNILTNIYVVKMLTYPFVFRLITKLVFIARLAKNKYLDKETRKRLKEDVAFRYLPKEVERISYPQLLWLGKTFGWRYLL